MNENNYYLKKSKAVLREVRKSVIGKDDVICKVYMAIIAGGHVLLDDIPGVGKTTMAHAFANALGLKYNRIQFTPDVMPSDITGFSMYNRQTGKFEFKQGAAMCNLLLADEINRTSPKTQSALLQIMEESKVTVDGNTYELPDPFVVIATQNPIGSIGTQKLPESQLDRFMIKLSMGYPQIEDEVAIMKSRLENGKNTQFSACVLEKGDIEGIREEVAGIYVDDSIYEYVAKIAAKTRSRENIIQGVSPRGSIAVIAMAKAASGTAEKLSLRDALAPAERRGRGNAYARGGWWLHDRILTDTALTVIRADVFARRDLLDPRSGTPLPTYRRQRYTGGIGRYFPIFLYIK